MQLLRKIGFPISLVYAVVVRLRNYFYDTGIFTGKSFATPTLCVGNLSVGGTGKTPMIEYLASELQDTRKIAVLSRGYGRRSKGFVLAGPNSTVLELGDEPFQIYSKFPGLTVAVDADRRNGISILEAEVAPDLILLDDAYQHRRVKPSFSILLTAYDHLYCDDWYLPTGDLRDSRYTAKRADLIVVTKCPDHLGQTEQNDIRKKLHPLPDQQVLFSTLAYDGELKGLPTPKPLMWLKTKKLTLVTGIARPQPLLEFLKGQGISFEHLSYRDHHFFTEKEIRSLNGREMVLTTEKDFVRLKGKVDQLCYLGIKHQFLGKGKKALSDALTTL